MAEMIQYPEYHTYFHREDSTTQETCKCPQCGKEITEYNNCVCPHCGAKTLNVLYHECNTLVSQVLSGYEESYFEKESASISEDAFKDRMNTLGELAQRTSDISKEIADHADNEYKAAEDKLDRFRNSWLYKITNGGISFLLALAKVDKDQCCVESVGAILVGIIFGAFSLLCAINAEWYFIMLLIGLYFSMVSIVGITSRVLSRPVDIWYGSKHWFSVKSTSIHQLRNFFKDKEYHEKTIGNYLAERCLESCRLYAVMSEDASDYSKNPFEARMQSGRLLVYQDEIIHYDCQKKHGIVLTKEDEDKLKNAEKEWRMLYAKYES